MVCVLLGTFYLYGCFAFVGIILFALCLPETKGKPLEEVEQLFSEPLISCRHCYNTAYNRMSDWSSRGLHRIYLLFFVIQGGGRVCWSLRLLLELLKDYMFTTFLDAVVLGWQSSRFVNLLWEIPMCNSQWHQHKNSIVGKLHDVIFHGVLKSPFVFFFYKIPMMS